MRALVTRAREGGQKSIVSTRPFISRRASHACFIHTYLLPPCRRHRFTPSARTRCRRCIIYRIFSTRPPRTVGTAQHIVVQREAAPAARQPAAQAGGLNITPPIPDKRLFGFCLLFAMSCRCYSFSCLSFRLSCSTPRLAGASLSRFESLEGFRLLDAATAICQLSLLGAGRTPAQHWFMRAIRAEARPPLIAILFTTLSRAALLLAAARSRRMPEQSHFTFCHFLLLGEDAASPPRCHYIRCLIVSHHHYHAHRVAVTCFCTHDTLPPPFLPLLAISMMRSSRKRMIERYMQARHYAAA